MGATELRFRRLKLSGFKSFVEPAELRIEPGLTGSRRPQRLRQVEPAGSDPLGDGRRQPEVASRRRDGRRHLRRHRDAPAARFRRSLDPDRARSRRGRQRRRRKRSHPPDRARRRLRLPDRRPRRPRRRTCRCCSPTPRPAPIRRRWSARADRRDHRRQADRAADDARGSGRHFRPSRATQGCRAEASCDRSQPRRGWTRLLSDQEQRASALEAAGACRRTLSRIDRQDPLGRGAAGSCPLGRGRPSRGRRGGRGGADRRSRGRHAAGRDGECAAGAGSGRQRSSPSGVTSCREARERATELAHELATTRARRDTVVRRLAELDRLDASLASDVEREEALRHDAEARIAELEAERPRSISALRRTRRSRRASAANLAISKRALAKPRPRSPIL